MSKVLQALNIKNPRLYLAIFLGMVFGLSVYAYWLIDILPPTSRWTFLFTALSSLIAAVIFLFLIELWVVPRWSALTKLQGWLLPGLSILTGAFLIFSGTNAWKSSQRYLVFLLPNEQFEISVPASQNRSNPDVAIQLFSTSMGDISFNSIKYQGWEREGTLLVLVNAKNNSLEWTGKVGEQATIVFSTSAQGGVVQISSGGEEETINLLSKTSGKYFYLQHFHIPFYASRAIVILLGLVDCSVFCFLSGLLIFEKRKAILDYLNQSILALPKTSRDAVGKSNKQAATKSVIALDWGIVIGAIALAILLRAFNLGYLSPFADEYSHLFAAKAIATGISLNAEYQRGLFIVTLPVALFFRLFGYELWVARLCGVLFNALAIIPLYLLTKKINRQIAFLSCILYATNPWLIAVSRDVREYAYYPFYFYWIIYGMIIFWECFPDNFLTAGWRKILSSDIIFPAGVLILPIIYMVMIDPTSTFKVIAIAYGVFGLLMLLKILSNNRVLIGLLAILFFLFLVPSYIYAAEKGYISFHPIETYWLRYFFPNPQQQWYFNRLALIPMIGLACAIFLGIQVYKSNFIPFFFVGLFSTSLLFYLFFFDRYIQARYIYNVEFWFIPLIAIGFYCIWSFLQLIFSGKKFPAILISLALLALSMNSSQILLPTFYNNYGWMPITEEYYDDVTMTQAFLLDKVKPGDVLISTDYGQYVSFEGNNTFAAIYYYNFQDKDPAGYVLSIISQHNSGWIVLDDQRYEATKPLPLKTTFVNNREIEYMGEIGNQYIWRWDAE
jgi:Dolichyl-phosphate-mannose-protein mannosyltransferase